VKKQRHRQVAYLAVGIVQVGLRQGKQFFLQGNRFLQELPPVQSLRIPAPVPQVATKAIPEAEEPATMANASRQNCRAEGLRAQSAIPRMFRFRCAQHNCMRPEW